MSGRRDEQKRSMQASSFRINPGGYWGEQQFPRPSAHVDKWQLPVKTPQQKILNTLTGKQTKTTFVATTIRK